MTPSKHRSWIFLFTGRVIKYLLLALFSFAVVCLITPIFGGFYLVEPLFEIVLQGFWRLAIVVLCLMAASVVVESLRQ